MHKKVIGVMGTAPGTQAFFAKFAPRQIQIAGDINAAIALTKTLLI